MHTVLALFNDVRSESKRLAATCKFVSPFLAAAVFWVITEAAFPGRDLAPIVIVGGAAFLFVLVPLVQGVLAPHRVSTWTCYGLAFLGGSAVLLQTSGLARAWQGLGSALVCLAVGYYRTLPRPHGW